MGKRCDWLGHAWKTEGEQIIAGVMTEEQVCPVCGEQRNYVPGMSSDERPKIFGLLPVVLLIACGVVAYWLGGR